MSKGGSTAGGAARCCRSVAPEIWQDCFEELKRVRMRLLEVRSNCEKFVTVVRRQAVKSGSVTIQHDSTEALKIERPKEVQSAHFGGSVCVSIEGHTTHFPSPDDETKILFDFHSFLSPNSLQQTASAVDNCMKRLVKCLERSNSLEDGGRVMGRTDGCAKWHKCSTAIR